MFLSSRIRRKRLIAALLVMQSAPSIAQAGMPGVVLTDLAKFRIEAISFFVVGFLACAGCVGWLWNHPARNVFKLPRLSYGKALGLMTLWGLLFLLVLTMISGARELMTPGAWTKRGLTYKLADAPPREVPPPGIEPSRRQKLRRLRDALRDYAAAHDGHLPGEVDSAKLADELWTTTDSSGMRYVYFGESAAGGDDRLIVMEPDVFHGPRLALTAAGKILEISVCFVGVVHQAIWLASTRLVERQGLTRSLQHESSGHLQQIGVAVREHERKLHRLPAATFSTAGRPLHSWQTAILPFTESRPLYDRIDHSAPWDAPVNHAAFHSGLPLYVPAGGYPRLDDRGYALSGYAANAYLLGGSRARRTSDITDGASQTIMAGEVISNARPWGDPVNWRDPALGIHTSPDAFGGPWPAVTQFIFADGHTAAISNDIAPALFRALSTPDGGDDVGDELRQ